MGGGGENLCVVVVLSPCSLHHRPSSVVTAMSCHCCPPVSIVVTWPLSCAVVITKGGRGRGSDMAVVGGCDDGRWALWLLDRINRGTGRAYDALYSSLPYTCHHQ
jgi:hypothetical protein